MQNGKIAFYSSVGGKTTLCSYDIAAKELTTREIEGTPSEMFYSNGDFYAITVNFKSLSFSYSLTKYDMNGGEDHILENVDNLEYAELMTTATGYLMIPDINMYLTPMFETKTLPELVTKDSHGLDTTVADLECIGSYGDSFYVTDQNSVDSTYALYCFNAATEEWTKVLDLAGSVDIGNHPPKCIGRYLVFVAGIASDTPYGTMFDMETNTVYADDIPNKPLVFSHCYYGGKRLILWKWNTQETWAFTPARGTTTEKKVDDVSELICTDTNVTLLDDTYYIHISTATRQDCSCASTRPVRNRRRLYSCSRSPDFDDKAAPPRSCSFSIPD